MLPMGASTVPDRDFEERLKKFLKICKSILFIDLLHTVGGEDQWMQATLPFIKQWPRCIGSTTYKEFNNYF